jgi:tetratricopeptide (TPR) repeat protein
MKDSVSAEKYYRKAIQVDPNSYKAHFRLGTLLMRQDLNSARESLQKAADIKENYYNAHETLGIVNMQLGKYDEAVKNFINTIDILGEKSSKRYKSLYLLADIFNSKEDYSTAREYALSAVDIKENGGAANYHLGIAYKNLDERYLAKSAFERASRDKDWRASAKYELDLMKK